MPQLDQNYVFMPQRLLADLRANPAAIGAYALLARLFLIYQEPIPLSAADLQRYDPSLSYGTARGALKRLTTLGWLQEHAGHKNRYTPTWGVIKGIIQPWRMDAPTLGRPVHVVTLRLDRRLLDVGIGRIIPHPLYPAETQRRYLDRPIFTLRDIGAYAQALSGQVLAATQTLHTYGLVCDANVRPLHSAADLVARASQRTIDGDGAALTAYGLRLLGIDYPNEAAAPSTKQSLFFVDHALIPDLIPPLIPDLIPSATEIECALSAAACAKIDLVDEASDMPGTSGILSEESDSPPNPPAHPNGGGGGDLTSSKKNDQGERQPKSEELPPETEAARLLQSIGAFPSSVEELANISAELVAGAIAYAESESGIASIPGWVVEALRRHRDEGWPIPEPRTKRLGLIGGDGLLDPAAYIGGMYGDLFRLGSDVTDLDVSAPDGRVSDAQAQSDEPLTAPTRPVSWPSQRSELAELDMSATALNTAALGAPAQRALGEHFRQDGDWAGSEGRAMDLAKQDALPQPGAGHAVVRRGYRPSERQGSLLAAGREASAPAHRAAYTTAGVPQYVGQSAPEAPAQTADRSSTSADTRSAADPERRMPSDAALTEELHAELMVQCGRRYRPVIAGLTLDVRADRSVLICANVSDMRVVQDQLLGALRGILARLGAPTQLMCTTRAGWGACQCAAEPEQGRLVGAHRASAPA